MSEAHSIAEQAQAEEAWRPVVGAEGEYEVSSIGRVRSLERQGVKIDGRRWTIKAKVLRPKMAGPGRNYATVNIHGNKRVSRIAYEAFIGPIPAGMEVDHQDRNSLNNAYANLRLATRSQNMMNRSKPPRNSSGAKGVRYDGRKKAGLKKWRASIRKNGKEIWLGAFLTMEEAIEAHRKGTIEHFGEFACLD